MSSAERIKIGDYRNKTDHDVSLVMSWKLREKERKVQVSLHSSNRAGSSRAGSSTEQSQQH